MYFTQEYCLKTKFLSLYLYRWSWSQSSCCLHVKKRTMTIEEQFRIVRLETEFIFKKPAMCNQTIVLKLSKQTVHSKQKEEWNILRIVAVLEWKWIYSNTFSKYCSGLPLIVRFWDFPDFSEMSQIHISTTWEWSAAESFTIFPCARGNVDIKEAHNAFSQGNAYFDNCYIA